MIKNKALLKNCLAILIPSIIAIIVFLLPGYIQEFFVLKMDQLNFWTWFTHIFVHQNIQHLSANITMYLASAFFAYFILLKKQKENFYKIVIASIILVPLIIFVLTLIFRATGLFPLQLINHRGFSGISSAASGFLAFAIAKRIQVLWGHEKNKHLLLNLCYFIFIPSLAVMVWRLSIKLSVYIFLFWIVLILNMIWFLKREKLILDVKKFNKKEVLFIAIGMAVLFFGVLLLIPEEIVQNGSATNTLAHLIGFMLGFVFMFVNYRNK
jgi:hypothetical protein